jgi:hypothetical protein
MDELYDLANDPYQIKNCIAEPARQGVLKEMQAELARLLRRS